MGLLHNETYYLPKRVGRRLGDRTLQALIADLVKSRTVVAPITVVTSKRLDLPLGRYTPLSDALLDPSKKPAKGLSLAYRGNDVAAAAKATSGRGDRDVVVCFA